MARPRSRLALLFSAPIVLAVASLAGDGLPAGAGVQPGPVRGPVVLSRLPLHFIENRGQVDARVAYYVHGRTAAFYFAPDGVTLALPAGPPTVAGVPATARAGRGERAPAARSRWLLRLELVGAVPVRPEGEAPTPARVSYFKGPRERWTTDLPTFARVRYREPWPGIDLVYGDAGGRLKYTFVVRPGAEPDSIRLAYHGASAVAVAGDGRLEIRGPAGGFAEERPYAYQDVDGRRVPVAAAWTVTPGAAPDVPMVGFRLGAYDRARPLVLDPVVLVYSGFIGGTSDDKGTAVAVDGLGHAYVVGGTSSADFLVVGGPGLVPAGDQDAFIAKVSADGSSLLYAGLIGGTGDDIANGVAVDSAGHAYVVGNTGSGDTFPAAVGPRTSPSGATDGFIAKVSVTGSGLVYAGFIGGHATDHAHAVALDPGQNAYVVGDTLSFSGFPVTGGSFDTAHNGFFDAFVVKVRADGTDFDYGGYIGGTGEDRAMDVAVDAAGQAYVVGVTDSSTAEFFPATPGAFDDSINGGSDVFVAKINAAGTGLVYCTYLGGSGDDSGRGIAVDAAGAVYVTGGTGSPDFPVTVGPGYGGGVSDAFVAKLAATGASLVYARFIGGALGDFGEDIALHGSLAYVMGWTASDEASFPLEAGPGLVHGGLNDAFVAKLSATGAVLIYAGYLGGAESDIGMGIAVDSDGDAYVTGFTGSDGTTFPVVVGPSMTFGGPGGPFGGDAFVAKIRTPVYCAVDDSPAPEAIIRASEDSGAWTATLGDGKRVVGGTARVIGPHGVKGRTIFVDPGIPGLVLSIDREEDTGCHYRLKVAKGSTALAGSGVRR